MKHQFTAILILIAMLLTSCGGTGASSDTSSAVDEETTVPVKEITSGVPSDLDLNGITVNIWSAAGQSVASENYISMNPEMTGEVLDDAIFAANRAVEEKLNVKLNYATEMPVGDCPNAIRTMILADDTTYDVYHFIQWSGVALCAEKLFMNVKDAPYISFDEPWWDSAYMNEMTIGDDKLYCLVGDFAVDRTRNMNCVFFNKKMWSDFYGNADSLYQTVLDGKWTMDAMMKVSEEVYSDLNNDGKPDRDDQLGYCLNTLSNLDGFFYGSGAKVTARDKDDIPYLNMMTEHVADVCKKLYKLAYETNGVFISGSSFEEEVANRQKFSENTSMFLVGFFYTAEALRDMNADYGIVPIPKYDEAQSDYITGLHNIMRDMALPINCQKTEAVCAVLEELAFQGNQNVIPAYYEVVLKNKYARDELSSQMLDLIKSKCATEIAYVYGTYFNSMGLLFRNMIGAKTDSLASLYASSESAAKQKMQTLIELFTEE